MSTYQRKKNESHRARHKRHEPGMNEERGKGRGGTFNFEMIKARREKTVSIRLYYYFSSFPRQLAFSTTMWIQRKTERKKSFYTCFRTRISCISVMVLAESTN